MKLARKDLAFGACALAILLVVVLGTGKNLGPDVPDDTEHQVFFTQLEQRQSRHPLQVLPHIVLQ